MSEKQQIPTLEAVIHDIFTSCDPQISGKAEVCKIIAYITPFINLSDLNGFKLYIESNNKSAFITKTAFAKLITQWAAKYKNKDSETISENINRGSSFEISSTSICNNEEIESCFGSKLLSGYAEAGILPLSSNCGDVYQDRSNLEDRIKELEYNNRKMTDEILQNKQQEQTFEETIDTLKTDLRSMTQRLTASQQMIELLQKDVSDLEELKNVNTKTTKTITEYEKIIQLNAKEIERFKEKLMEIELEKEVLNEKVTSLKEKENKLQSSLSEIHEQLLDQNDLVEIISNDNLTFKSRDVEQKTYIRELKNIIETLKSEQIKEISKNLNSKLPNKIFHNITDINTMNEPENVVSTNEDNVNLFTELQESFELSSVELNNFSQTNNYFPNTFQSQLDAIEHRCCKETKIRLSKQIEGLYQQIDNCNESAKKQEQEIKDLVNTIKDNNTREINYNETIEELKNKLKSQEKSVTEKDLELSKLKIDYSEIDSYSKNVKEEFEKNFIRMQELQNNLDEVRLSNVGYLEEVDKLRSDLEIIKKSKKCLEQQNIDLKLSESECEVLKQKISSLSNSQNELDAKLRNSLEHKENLERKMGQLIETIQVLDRKNNEISGANVDLLKESDELNKKLDTRIKELQVNHERKLEEVSRALENKKVALDELVIEANKDKKMLGAIKDDNKQLELQVHLLEVRLKEISKWNASLKADKEVLSEELTTSQNFIKSMETTNEQFKNKCAELKRFKLENKKQLEDYEVIIAELKAKYDSNLQYQKEKDARKIYDLENSIASMKETQGELVNMKSDLAKKLTDARSNLEELDGTIFSLMQSEGDLRENYERLMLEYDDLDREVYKLQNETAGSERIKKSLDQNTKSIMPQNDHLNNKNVGHQNDAITSTICDICSKQNDQLTPGLNDLQQALKHSESYGKLTARFEKLQEKLLQSEDNLVDSNTKFIDATRKFEETSLDNKALQKELDELKICKVNLEGDLVFVNTQMATDSVILQSVLEVFVSKWKEVLVKLENTEELLTFIRNDGSLNEKSFPGKFKELHLVRRCISFVVLSLTIVSESPILNSVKDTLEFSNNSEGITKFTLKRNNSNIGEIINEFGTGDSFANNKNYELSTYLNNLNQESTPSLNNAVLETLYLNNDCSETLTTGPDLEDKICQLMVSFMLDRQTVTSRCEQQRHLVVSLDEILVKEIQNLGLVLEGCVGDGKIQNQCKEHLHKINQLTCQTSQSAEQLGAILHEKKLQKSLHLITNYIAKLEKKLNDLKPAQMIDKSVDSTLTIKNANKPAIDCIEISTQTRKQSYAKTNKYFLIFAVCFLAFAVLFKLSANSNNSHYSWQMITWDEIFDQLIKTTYQSGRPM